LKQTLDCIDTVWKINKDVKVNGLFFATPFPGTELFELAKIHGYVPPQSLGAWGDIDFILSYRNVPYIPNAFKKDLTVYAFIIRFRYLWMHTASFLKNKKNMKTSKYWSFFLFRILFKPIDILFTIRWKNRMTIFPIDIAFARSVLSKIAA
jgi:hypothetical protein